MAGIRAPRRAWRRAARAGRLALFVDSRRQIFRAGLPLSHFRKRLSEFVGRGRRFLATM
ncbi:hypothetical protein CBM2634_U30009 [Cupriavidus taiwanensis]|uniref:Uncharacterized protein n=1 Tax=Cupriavidus taiwanensis TaxID=164546 RepID=A0A375JCD5_9BURK|nr:hypothetical protein CBM2634_U30009 [Cupriavidus taiwanensis]